MKQGFKYGLFLPVVFAICISSTPAKAGFFGRSVAGGLLGGGYNNPYYEEEMRRREAAARLAKQQAEEKRMRMYMMVGGVMLVGIGGYFYYSSRRRKTEAANEQNISAQLIQQMKAQILFYNPSAQTGKISTPQGKRYVFKADDVISGLSGLKFGADVDFEIGENDTALNIKVICNKEISKGIGE